ncbi:MAG: 50S ribosomal protein L6 [Proteobacteria bacterium]|nr:50S ribosomal protein L6 [Pseudomonadota bacterium]
MSRIGKKIIEVPATVKVSVASSVVSVEGPKGKLSSEISPLIELVQEGQKIECKFTGNEDQKAIHGITRTLVTNMIQGCQEGFKKILEVNGVGYRAAVSGQALDLSLGYSHPIKYAIPTGITITVDKQTIITISGANKQLVGQVDAEIRDLRKPEPYKGKGVKYQEEVIKRKAGKSATA